MQALPTEFPAGMRSLARVAEVLLSRAGSGRYLPCELRRRSCSAGRGAEPVGHRQPFQRNAAAAPARAAARALDRRGSFSRTLRATKLPTALEIAVARTQALPMVLPFKLTLCEKP